MASKPLKKKRVARVDDSPPWDDGPSTALTVHAHDVSDDAIPRRSKNTTSNGKFRGPMQKTEPVQIPVSALGDLMDDHDDYGRAMNKLAKRVSNLDRPYNSVAIKEEATRQALSSILRLVKLSEMQYIETRSDKSSYAHANLLQMQQSLLAEMATMVTTDAQAERVISEVMRPAFQDVLQFIVAEVSAIRQGLTNVKDVPTLQRNTNQALQSLLRNLGTYMQEASDKAESQTAQALR